LVRSAVIRYRRRYDFQVRRISGEMLPRKLKSQSILLPQSTAACQSVKASPFFPTDRLLVGKTVTKYGKRIPFSAAKLISALPSFVCWLYRVLLDALPFKFFMQCAAAALFFQNLGHALKVNGQKTAARMYLLAVIIIHKVAVVASLSCYATQMRTICPTLACCWRAAYVRS
jgi:hypothetical protein